MEIYEYTENMTSEKNASLAADQRWIGDRWNKDQTSEQTLQSLKPGRQYHIRSLAPFKLSCSSVSCSGTGCGLQVTYDARGINTVSYNGYKFTDTTLYQYDDQQISGPYGGTFNRTNAQQVTWDASAKTWRMVFAWGIHTTKYEQDGDNLNVTATIQNTSTGAYAFPVTRFFYMRLPVRTSDGTHVPTDWPSQHYPRVEHNYLKPSVARMTISGAVVSVVNPDLSAIILSGIASGESPQPWMGGTPDDLRYAVLVGGVDPYGRTIERSENLPKPPLVQPGTSQSYTVSVRFAPEGTPEEVFAGDAYDAWREGHPNQMGWPDRRPIAALQPPEKTTVSASP